MATLRPTSFRGRLILLVTLTCALAVALAYLGMIAVLYHRTVQDVVADKTIRAELLATNLSAAVMFEDRKAVAEMLHAFEADPKVAGVFVFDHTAGELARYVRRDAELPPVALGEYPTGFDGAWLSIPVPIAHDDEVLGDLVLVADMRPVYRRFMLSAALAGVLAMVIIGVAVYLAGRFSRALTRPIAELADVAGRVSRTSDYSLRVKTTGEDEVGRFAGVFNQMLQRVEEQTAQIAAANDALRKSERIYRAIGESINYGIWICDRQGRNIYASDSFLKLVGITQEQCSAFGWGEVLHPDDLQRTIQAWKDCVAREGFWDIEHRFRGVDGQWHPVLARGVLVRDEDGQGICWAGINLDISSLKEAQESLRRLNATLEQRVAQRTAEAEHRALQLRALTSELTQAEERERRRLAQALHDNLQQVLVAAQMRVSLAQRQGSGADERIRATLAQVGQLLASSIDISRSLTMELSPPVLYDAGLGAALQWLSRQMLEKHDLTVNVEVDPKVEPVPEETAAFLFQAARELLFNVVKHAKVNAAHVKLGLADRMIELAIIDRGVGIDTQQMNRQTQGGFGLFSIRERLNHLGGATIFAQTPGGGTTIILRAPRSFTGASTRPGPAPADAPPTDGAPPHEPRDKPIRVLVADDHQILRDGIAELLRPHSDIELVGQASNGLEAIDLATRLNPDVVIMDVNMPVLSGVEATRRIIERQPGVRVIGLSMHAEQDFATTMRDAGAVAYLTKGGPAEKLIEEIHRVTRPT